MTRAYGRSRRRRSHPRNRSTCGDRYIDPAFPRAPGRGLSSTRTARERLGVEGKLLGNPRGDRQPRLGRCAARHGQARHPQNMPKERRAGSTRTRASSTWISTGSTPLFLYPSLGLFAGAVSDPELAAAMCRAYNRWLADYCKAIPGPPILGSRCCPMQSVDLAIDEMRFARETLGMRGGFPAAEPLSRHQDDQRTRCTSRFWTMAEELDFSIGFHEGSTTAMPTVGVDRF